MHNIASTASWADAAPHFYALHRIYSACNHAREITKR